MEENIDWLFNDPLPHVDMASCEPPLKTEVKCEPGCEEQLHDGTDVKTENTVKEEVQVKMEREDKASVVQCLCLSSPGGCGACVLKCGKTEASIEGECAGMEGEEYLYKRNAEGKWQPYVLLKSVPEVDLGGCSSLGPAEGEQCLEGGSVCEQEQAADRAAGWGRWQVEGADECGSVCVKGEKGGRNVGREGVVQPLVSMDDCKVEVKTECFCEETGGEKVQVEGGVPVQARPESSVATGVRWSVCDAQWSDGSSAPVASSSNLEVSEAGPCVSSEETTQLLSLKRRSCSPPMQQQCEKKGRVQSAGGAVHAEDREAACSESDALRTPRGLKKHVCPHCNYSCVLEDALTIHLETVHEDLKKHACPHCQYRTVLKTNLRRHIETVHEGLKNHACPHCPYRAGHKSNLQTHIDTVHEGLKKHACPHCQFRASRKYQLEEHIDTVHEGLKRFSCPHCQYRAYRKGTLQRHIDTVHEGLKNHPCPQCPYRAGEKGTLKAHIDAVHAGIKKHPCPHCQYRASKNCTLKTHIDVVHGASLQQGSLTETVHEDLRKHACPHCQYRTVLKTNLKRHIETVHEGLKNHACPHCQYRTGHKGNLLTHIDTVHEGLKKHACPHCQFKASRKYHLEEHIDSVHEGLKRFACPHCFYRAYRKGTLQRHIDTVHEGSKKHACPHCPFRAGEKSNLQAHVDAVHAGIKKHACPHCQYRASRRGTLKAHIDTVHEGLPDNILKHT